MIKTLNFIKLVQNSSFTFIRQSTSFATEFMEALQDKKEELQQKHVEKNKKRKERYHGKLKRREWDDEDEEAKRARLENPVDRVKRKKALILLGYSGVNYCGMQRNPEIKTIEEELLKAMLKNKWITEDAFKQPQYASFQRAARTDKGVSASRQIVSLKLPEDINVEALNQDLPDDIKVFAVKKTTKGFNSKTTCDARTYSYTLPTYIFTKDNEEINETSFRLSSERFEELNKVLNLFIGSKNFHNFTIKKEPCDPSSRRFIMSFECQQPFVPDNTEVEFARLKITGQSFMMHQIRRMIGMTLAVMRGYVGHETIEKALLNSKMLIPQAPGLGLVLDNVHYTRYNDRFGDDGHHEALNFEDEEDAVEEFFRKNIISTIIETELKESPMKIWVGRLRKHEYDPEKAKEAYNEASEEKDGYSSD